MRCEKCDAELKEGAKFCNKCGEMIVRSDEAKKGVVSAKLNNVQSISQPIGGGKNKVSNEATPSSESKKLNTYATIGFAVAIIVCLIGFVSCNCNSCNGDSELAISATTASETKEEPTTEEPTTEEPTTEEPTTEEPTTEEPTTEKPTEPPTEPPTEKPTEFTDTLTELYSNDDVNIYYSRTKPYPYGPDEVDVYFYVENKTDMQLEFQADTVILDGICYNDVTMSDPISAGTIGEINMSIDDCNNSDPSSVGADLRYFNSEHDYRQEIQIGSKDID